MKITDIITETDDSAQKAKAWIDKVYNLYPQTWQNNHVMPLGGEGENQQFALFELVPSLSKRGAVEVKWFQAYPLRQGVGSRAMQELQRLASEDGIALTLYAWDKGQVSRAKLMKFYKQAGFNSKNKSPVMSWEPVLDEMPLPTDWDRNEFQQGKSSFKSRLAYALERAKKLGVGSSRVAMIIEYEGRQTVLKIAKNGKGLAQNNAEASILDDGYASQLGILIPLIDYDTEHEQPLWIHTEMATKATEKQLCALMKCGTLSLLVNYAWSISGKKRYMGLPEKYIESFRGRGYSDQDIETCSEYANALVDLANSFDVELGDFARAANWGLYQGKPVIIDVGFTTNVFQTHYKR